MTPKRSSVIESAIAWWEGKRPVAWNKQQHLANPTINTDSDAEWHLALAVATHIKRRIKRGYK